MTRVVDIADGFTSATEPTVSMGSTNLLENFANDAAFVSANGTAQKGDIYFNTTSNVPKYFNGTTWENIADNDTIADHISDTTDAHAGTAITNTPSGNLAATTVQGALNELQSDVDSRALASDLTTHISDTTTHGTTGDIVGTTDTQTLSAKTFGDAVTMTQVSTPSNPSASKNKLYFKSDDKLYKLTSGGVESEVAGSSSTERIAIIKRLSGSATTVSNTASTATTAPLTTLTEYGTSFLSIGSNQITIESGTYEILWNIVVTSSISSYTSTTSGLYNTTDTAYIEYGSPLYQDNNSTQLTSCPTIGYGVFTIGASKVLELRQLTYATSSGTTQIPAGTSTGSPVNIRIRKLA